MTDGNGKRRFRPPGFSSSRVRRIRVSQGKQILEGIRILDMSIMTVTCPGFCTRGIVSVMQP